jgi:hypothetical protein
MRLMALIILCLAMASIVAPTMQAQAAGARIDGNGAP